MEWVATGPGAIDLLEKLDAFNRAEWKNGEATEKAGLILVRRVGLIIIDQFFFKAGKPCLLKLMTAKVFS